MRNCVRKVLCILSICLSTIVLADDLVQMAQQDLVTLGYDPGNIEGEATTQTVIAISRFQAENGMTVDGEATPQLVGVLRAAIKKQNSPVTIGASSTSSAMPTQNQSDLPARQQACLQEKMEAAQEAQKKKRAFMKLLSAVSRSSGQFGDGDASRAIPAASSEAYKTNATYEDLKGAAKDLGLSEEEMEECRNA